MIYCCVVTVRENREKQKRVPSGNGNICGALYYTHTCMHTHIKALHQGPPSRPFILHQGKVLEEQTARGARNVMREQYEQLRSPRVWTFQQGAAIHRVKDLSWG